MNVLLRCISNDDDNVQLRQQTKKLFNRSLSFTDYILSSVENHHCLTQLSGKNSFGELEHNLDENHSASSSYLREECSRTFASKYEVDYHKTMFHPNQPVYCSDCNAKFRSNRALKSHQQQFHLTYSQDNLPDYSYISSYLVIAFSTKQFPLIAKNACEQKRLPLGYLSSKLFQCHYCFLSFPCSRTLNHHVLNKHEHYEYRICRKILHDIILQVEQNLILNDDDDIESIGLLLSRRASDFGLLDKKLAKQYHCLKQEQYDFTFPSCQHQNRTCANLCLKNLSSYNKLIQDYPYKITTLPKGNPFAQGCLLSKPLHKSTVNTPVISKENVASNQKRSSLKRAKSSLSDDLSASPSKKRILSTVEQTAKTNETKLNSGERISSNLISPKKVVHKTKPTYVRSLSSMSNSSSTSTRKSSKNVKQQPTTSFKRSISPTITLAVERSAEKRRRQRELRKAKNSSASNGIIKANDEVEQQENDDDDNNNNIVSIKADQTKQQRRNKQRQESNSSVEYVQILNYDQQSIPSLNNIENLKEKSAVDDDDDDEIIICNSPPSSSKKSISSSKKSHLEKSVNGTNTHKSNSIQPPDYDENVRVRCKICGDILQGRSRFSKHVLTMHSHLVKTNISTMKQQSTTIVR